MVARALEKSPQVRFLFVPGSAAIVEAFGDWFLAGLGIVLLVPLFEIGFAQGLRIAGSVVAGRFVFTGLREVSDVVFGDFENALGTLEAINLRRLAAEIEAQINGSAAVIEKRGVNVGHVAAVLEAQDIAESHGALGRLVPAEHEGHAADEMDKKIAGEAGAVFLPAAPAREILGSHVRIPSALGGVALPGVPIEVAEGKIGRRRINPCAGRIVAAERTFNERERADDTVGEKLFCFRADHGADAL